MRSARENMTKTKRKISAKYLSKLNDALANLLVDYANAAKDEITCITLPEGKEMLGTRHIIVLAAELNSSGKYSLRQIKDSDNGRPKETGETEEKAAEKESS